MYQWQVNAGALASVVGINLPTFVERPTTTTRARRGRRVSSGLTSRPSLSGQSQVDQARQEARVVTSRPSLSGRFRFRGGPRTRRVVGINLPTFVERRSAPARPPRWASVSSGLNLPTFVERKSTAARTRGTRRVSSGLTSRPSLSGAGRRGAARFKLRVSSGLTSRPSLSAQHGVAAGLQVPLCRRD